jgi:protein-S-isoprenylcysteine O-methyltransferase Ste14
MPTPQLTVGKPIDLTADVPVFPPFAMFSVVGVSLILCLANRLRFLPAATPTWSRVLVFAIALGYSLMLLKKAGGDLESAGSGTFFTPVGGLATGGFYQFSRNPMYASLVFAALPAFAVVLDTLWPIILSPILWAYFNFVVIAAEEQLLQKAFGAGYDAYCSTVPRWVLFF